MHKSKRKVKYIFEGEEELPPSINQNKNLINELDAAAKKRQSSGKSLKEEEKD